MISCRLYVKTLAPLCLLFSFLAFNSVFARFVVEKNSITVISPSNLKSKHDGSIANFGVPHYGGSMVGSVVYPDNKNSTNGCQEFGGVPFKSNSSHPNFLLLDRRECYFVLKVWHGQQAGAAAVLVADDVDEPLFTMKSPEEDPDAYGYVSGIGIPSALIDKSFADSLKQALEKGENVVLRLDWREVVPHLHWRVEYELWTSGNDECGARCDEQMDFIKTFKGHAQILEKTGYTLFTPHYLTWFCQNNFKNACTTQCINHGRYCAPDPDKDLKVGYQGKDVVYENLRQLCVHRVANESGKSWVWWDYVTDYHIRCSMKEKRYNKGCAEDMMESLDLPIEKIKKCMGDPEADVENQVLKLEQELQVGQGSRGDITILPTMVINGVQYRGKLERKAVLKAICSGFMRTTEPTLCLGADIETNECLEKNGGCWNDLEANITACKDTFMGRICKCPTVNGIQYVGDGYKSCKADEYARCKIKNGGCWSETRNGLNFSACSENQSKGCQCPQGFRGDGHHCIDIDECKEGLACQCNSCSCKNNWGGYECKCNGNHLYIKEHNVCIERIRSSRSGFGWFLTFFVVAALVGGGYMFYKYRLRSYMDSEITAIMSQYMPLDNRHEAQPLQQQSSVA